MTLPIKSRCPLFPGGIGVVTAKTGAALQDIIHILSRRYPLAELVLYPALVQGDLAPDSLVKAIGIAGRDKPDVLIVGRGGGSLEDLWAFNDERVARAVYNCPVPVISAVGHEVDYTICDLVADLRAPTPSAAAELCAPDISGLKEELSDLREALRRGLSDRIRMEEASLRALSRRWVFLRRKTLPAIRPSGSPPSKAGCGRLWSGNWPSRRQTSGGKRPVYRPSRRGAGCPLWTVRSGSFRPA